MNGVRVDPGARRGRRGRSGVTRPRDPGAGLATTGGFVSTTGVAGFTLGGGIGWLMRKLGLACDNLVGVDVVTADGRSSARARTRTPICCGDCAVAAATLASSPIRARCTPSARGLRWSDLLRGRAAADLLRRFRGRAADAPDEITAVLAHLTTAPPLPVIPEEWHGKKVIALVVASAGPADEAEAQVSAFRTAAVPVADLLGPMPYSAIQTLLDPLWPKGIHAYFKATNLARLDDELIERLVRAATSAALGPHWPIFDVHQMGGAVARVGDGRHRLLRALHAVRPQCRDRLARRRRRGCARRSGRAP